MGHPWVPWHCTSLLHLLASCGDLLRLAYSKHIISPIMFMLMNTRTLCTTNSINFWIELYHGLQNSFTSGCLGAKYTLVELKMPIFLACFTSFLATHLWSFTTEMKFPGFLGLHVVQRIVSQQNHANFSKLGRFCQKPNGIGNGQFWFCKIDIFS
jgi:hypothetical protein